MIIQQGQIIPLFVQLIDCSTVKYVQAWLTDNANNPIGSPLPLLPFGSWGGYSNYTLVMPNFPFVIAQYIVFSDSGYSILDPIEGASSDTFILGGGCGCF